MPEIFNSEILEKKMITPSVARLRFSLPKKFDFIPGQYLSVSRISDGKKLRTPYSISSVPGDKFGEFCVKVMDVGKTSFYLAGLKKGDEIELFGPLGKFAVNESSREKDLIFISTGTGVTPFVSMISDLLEKGNKQKIILLKGFRKESEILCDEKFSELRKKYPNFSFQNILSKPENNPENKGRVQDFMDKYIGKDFKGDYYICGLGEMVDDVIGKLKKEGVGEDRIFYEKYD